MVSGVEFYCGGPDVEVQVSLTTTNGNLVDYMVGKDHSPTSGTYLKSCSAHASGSAFDLSFNLVVPSTSSTMFADMVRVASDGDTSAEAWVRLAVGTDCGEYLTWFPELSEQEREERRLARLAAEERRQADEQAAWARRLTAESRALKLLASLLAPEQLESLMEMGHFDVRAPNGKVYRLFYALHGNVLRMDEQLNPEQAFCGHMGASLPIVDTLVSQRLILSHNPEEYERMANVVSHEHTGWCRPRDDFKEVLRLAMEMSA